MDIKDKIYEKHYKFVKENGHNPEYAIITGRYLDEEHTIQDIVKLSVPENTEKDPDDHKIFFYADGLEGMMELYDSMCEEFIVTDINEFTDRI